MSKAILADTSSTLGSYVTIADAATALAVDQKTIRRKIAAGELPAFKVGASNPGTARDTRLVRIPAVALSGLLEPIVPTSMVTSRRPEVTCGW